MGKEKPLDQAGNEKVTARRSMIENELDQERYLMAALMDNVPDHIYFKDLESRFIRNNLAHTISFGLKDPAELVGKSDFDFFQEEIARRQYNDEQEIIRTGLSMTVEERTIRSDGSVNWYLSTKMPLRDKNGIIVGTFGISRDITQRKEAEHELKKLSLAVEQSPVSIVITDPEGDIEYANPKACETTGYSLRELIGQNPRVLKSGETSSNEYSFLWNSISTGNQWKGLFHNKKKNGELYWESATIAPIRDFGGNITHYLGVKEDITERLLVEKALKESESQLRSFFDLPLIGHAISSPLKKWVEVNDSLCNMLGYSKSELMQTTWVYVTHPEDVEADERQFDKVMSGEIDGYTMEKRFIRKDKQIVNTHLAVQSMRNPDRSVNYFMVVIVDITAIKNAEEVIRQKNEELIKINAEKDKFFSIIAHDLRSPFNTFLNLSKIIAEDIQEMNLEEVQKIATSMSRSATSLFELLENLLEWARLQRDTVKLNPEVINLKKSINKMLNSFTEPAKEKGIVVHADVPDRLEVVADTMMIESTIRNLMSNALKFTHKGGKVDIIAENCPGNHCVKVSVRDSGIGMNHELLQQLFKLNENVSRKGTAGESSSGLGLLLCKEFVEKHGGRIWAESEEEKGSTFSFTIPEGNS